MPRDPQGAGTRTETRVEWRSVYGSPFTSDEWRSPVCYGSRKAAVAAPVPCEATRIAVERIETTTTITREPIAPHAGEETKG